MFINLNLIVQQTFAAAPRTKPARVLVLWNQCRPRAAPDSAMPFFLAKTDPDTYPASQFAAEGRTVWDGVTNAQAVNVIKTLRPKDRVFIYHSGGESAVVALARVVSAPRPDAANPKSWVVELEFLRDFTPPVTLKEIKATGLFGQWALIRQGRLSTMAAPDEFADWMRARYPRGKW
jgi:predicted RNA-binding protein with PUA-like domain